MLALPKSTRFDDRDLNRMSVWIQQTLISHDFSSLHSWKRSAAKEPVSGCCNCQMSISFDSRHDTTGWIHGFSELLRRTTRLFAFYSVTIEERWQ